MRKRVNWYKVMLEHANLDIVKSYYRYVSKLWKGKSMSSNRCAYYALKDYYSTTTIAELCECLGI